MKKSHATDADRLDFVVGRADRARNRDVARRLLQFVILSIAAVLATLPTVTTTGCEPIPIPVGT